MSNILRAKKTWCKRKQCLRNTNIICGRFDRKEWLLYGQTQWNEHCNSSPFMKGSSSSLYLLRYLTASWELRTRVLHTSTSFHSLYLLRYLTASWELQTLVLHTSTSFRWCQLLRPLGFLTGRSSVGHHYLSELYYLHLLAWPLSEKFNGSQNIKVNAYDTFKSHSHILWWTDAKFCRGLIKSITTSREGWENPIQVSKITTRFAKSWMLKILETRMGFPCPSPNVVIDYFLILAKKKMCIIENTH